MTPTRSRQRVLFWLILSVLAGLAGTAGLIVGAQRLGEVAYNAAVPSFLGLLVPLLLGALLETVSVAAGGIAGVELSTRLRRQALDHALMIDPDQAETIGAGTALARAMDTDLVGSFLVITAPAAILGAIEVVVGLTVGARAPDGSVRIAIVLVGVILLAGGWRILLATRRKWTTQREQITTDLLERLIGQRTVALQENTQAYRSRLDELTGIYRRDGRRLDAATVIVTGLMLLIGTSLVLLALQLRSRSGASSSALAVGSALLTGTGLLRLGRVVTDLAGVQVAREQIAGLAAMKLATRPVPAMVDREADGPALIRAAGIVGEYEPGAPVVGPLDLTVKPGARLLLTGPSGSGKTTLVEMLDGRRVPAAGTIEHDVRCVIARVPQAGDDHLLHGSLMFNILLGRSWPPENSDINDALEVLDDLGLTELVSRMPAGILQSIGDGGWRLSAGESARIRLARALLRRPDLLILDETFGPLDALTFQRCLNAAEKWASGLLVIAHT